MIERVARAIEKQIGVFQASDDDLERAAKSAIAAMREPTREMWGARPEGGSPRDDWHAMIDAAMASR